MQQDAGCKANQAKHSNYLNVLVLIANIYK